MGKYTASSTATEVLELNFPYHSMVDALLYIGRGTCFDIAYVVGVLSRSLENSTFVDVGQVKCAIRYLCGTRDLKLVYRNESKSNKLKCFSDVDFAGCLVTLCLTTGALVKYAEAAIMWFSCWQSLKLSGFRACLLKLRICLRFLSLKSRQRKRQENF